MDIHSQPEGKEDKILLVKSPGQEAVKNEEGWEGKEIIRGRRNK